MFPLVHKPLLLLLLVLLYFQAVFASIAPTIVTVFPPFIPITQGTISLTITGTNLHTDMNYCVADINGPITNDLACVANACSNHSAYAASVEVPQWETVSYTALVLQFNYPGFSTSLRVTGETLSGFFSSGQAPLMAFPATNQMTFNVNLPQSNAWTAQNWVDFQQVLYGFILNSTSIDLGSPNSIYVFVPSIPAEVATRKIEIEERTDIWNVRGATTPAASAGTDVAVQFSCIFQASPQTFSTSYVSVENAIMDALQSGALFVLFQAKNMILTGATIHGNSITIGYPPSSAQGTTTNSPSPSAAAAPIPPPSSVQQTTDIIIGVVIGAVVLIIGISALAICIVKFGIKRSVAPIAFKRDTPFDSEAQESRESYSFIPSSSSNTSVSSSISGVALQVATFHETPRSPARIPQSGILSGMVTARSKNAYDTVEVARSEIGCDNDNLWTKITKGEVIGQGSFGKVYLGLDVNDGSMYAIKEMLIDHDIENCIRELKLEVETMIKLEDPHIVQYFGMWKEPSSNVVNIILEYVPGGSLLTILSRFGVFKDSLARTYIRQALQGLAYLHNAGIVHRDIKPANILVDHLGNVKLADFGALRKLTSGGTMSADTGSIRGTPVYMAPECIRQTKSGRKSDVWSMGCTALHLLTGKLPWSEVGADNAHALLFKIAMTETGPNYDRSGFSSDLNSFLEQCFLLDPEKRPSAAELLVHPWVNRPDSPRSSVARRTPPRSPSKASSALGKDWDSSSLSVSQLEDTVTLRAASLSVSVEIDKPRGVGNQVEGEHEEEEEISAAATDARITLPAADVRAATLGARRPSKESDGLPSLVRNAEKIDEKKSPVVVNVWN